MDSNFHLNILEKFYIKNLKKEKSVEVSAKEHSVIKEKQKESDTFVINFNWNYEDIKNDIFTIPEIENSKKLNNYSFIHSILYIYDNLYYSSSTEQKLRDCKETIEIIRSNLYKKSKISKEDSEIIKNLENNVYSENTIQFITNYFNSFHLIILNSNESPKLFINGSTKKDLKTYKNASSLIVIYYDTLKELYYPLEYNLENRDTFYISWREKEFMEFLRKIYLYGKPNDTKKWLVADLRDWIRFFCIDIDIKLDKKSILEKFIV